LDSREARIVLGRYRPGLDDPRSAPFAEALELARTDPELTAWLEREVALDAAIGDKLRQADVPPDLASRILAGRPAMPPRAWWKRPLVSLPALALVAAAVIVVVALVRRAAPAGFPSYREQMGAIVAGDYKLNIESHDPAAVREFFARRQWPADYSVPARLQGYPVEGGMTVEWRGRRISLVCFGVEDDDDKDLWLFIAEPDAVPGAPPSSSPEFAPAGKLMTAAWSAARKIYLLASRGDERSLRELLPDLP
jgi:hypothetical protein